jgi:hypothetical protein
LIINAIKAVIGVGTNREQIPITPLKVILFAFLVAIIFLGSISLLLSLASLFIT